MGKKSKIAIYGFIFSIIVIIFGLLVVVGLNQNISPNNIISGPHWTNVQYANVSPAEKMDIYLPNSIGPYPVVIWIHGGGFESGDKSGNGAKPAMEALSRGYAVVSINYRLSKDAKFPAQINDVKAAIRFLRANAKEYDLNPNKIAVWGSSAGRGLAALAGTSGNVKELQNDSLGYGNVSNQVQAVVDENGPINFGTLLPQLENDTGTNNSLNYNASKHMLKLLLGNDVSLVPYKVTKSNPETYIRPEDPPFFIEHGTADTIIPYQQSVDFANKLKMVLGNKKVTLVLLPGVGHNENYNTLSNINNILNFLDKNLK